MMGQPGKIKFQAIEKKMPQMPPMGNEEKESAPGMMNKGAKPEDTQQLANFSDDMLRIELEKRGFKVEKAEEEESEDEDMGMMEE